MVDYFMYSCGIVQQLGNEMRNSCKLITLLLLIGSTLLLVACVRPTPRPENVQITEVPDFDPMPITPTPELVITVVATTEGELPSEGSSGQEGGEVGEASEDGTTAVTWPQSHEVIAGDTLSRISLIYNVSMEEIIAANGLTNPDDLELGQLLTIPEPGTVDLTAVATPTATESEAEVPTTPTETIYIVQAGDTLFRIALAYGTTVDALADFNDITNINALEIGQEIVIPPAE